MATQKINIFRSLPQRWNAQIDDIQPEIQIFPETSRFNLCSQIPVGGRHNPAIHMQVLIAAHAFAFTGCQEVQKLGLQPLTDVADFIKESRPPGCAFETSGFS